LFKEEIDIDADGPVWRRIFGGIFLSDLKSLVESDADLFFMTVDFKFVSEYQIVRIILRTMNTEFSGYTRMMNVSIKYLKNQFYLSVKHHCYMIPAIGMCGPRMHNSVLKAS
jgi:hypothetical protein